MNLKKIGKGKFLFSGWRNDKNIRWEFTADEIWTRMGYDVRSEENLGPGAVPVNFETFCREEYLPKEAMPRLRHRPLSFQSEEDYVDPLIRHFGKMNLHEVGPARWEEFKEAAKSGELRGNGKPYTDSSIIHYRGALKRIISYAVRRELLSRNTMVGHLDPAVKAARRSAIYLKKDEILRLLAAIKPGIERQAVELAIFTGARVGELRIFRGEYINFAQGEVGMPTEKKKDPITKRWVQADQVIRYFTLNKMCPRLRELLLELRPHPVTGYVFTNKRGKPRGCAWFRKVLYRALAKAGLTRIHFHDLRGTFTVHRALVVRDFYQLQTELGHESSESINAYLGFTARMNAADSIFFLDSNLDTASGNLEIQRHENFGKTLINTKDFVGSI